MFEESLVESTSLLRTRNRWPAIVSIAVQAALAAAIIAVPLLHPDLMPLRAPAISLTPPVPPKPPAPIPVERVHLESAVSGPSVPTLVAVNTNAPQLTRTLEPSSSDEPPAIGSSILPMGDGNSNSLTSVLSSATSSSPAVAVRLATKIGPVRVSPGVSVGLLLAPIRPVYPPIALAAHLQGTVVVHAIISKAGAIESASAVSGPEMLRPAALDAVRMARYKPYRLGSEPVEVDTTFEINFRLNQ